MNHDSWLIDILRSLATKYAKQSESQYSRIKLSCANTLQINTKEP